MMRTILQILIGSMILGAIIFALVLAFQYEMGALILLGIPLAIIFIWLAWGIGRHVLGDDKNDPPSYDV